MNINNMITYSSLLFIYNITNNNKPKSIVNIYRQSKYNRHRANLSLNTVPKKNRYSKFFLQEHTNTYNDVPIDVKSSNKAIFKRDQTVDSEQACGYHGLNGSCVS